MERTGGEKRRETSDFRRDQEGQPALILAAFFHQFSVRRRMSV
jgi:hypothetical protein